MATHGIVLSSGFVYPSSLASEMSRSSSGAREMSTIRKSFHFAGRLTQQCAPVHCVHLFSTQGYELVNDDRIFAELVCDYVTGDPLKDAGSIRL